MSKAYKAFGAPFDYEDNAFELKVMLYLHR